MNEPKLKSTDVGRENSRPTELDSLSVAELRQIARSLVRIPLSPREISSVRRKRLIDAIRTVIDMD